MITVYSWSLAGKPVLHYWWFDCHFDELMADVSLHKHHCSNKYCFFVTPRCHGYCDQCALIMRQLAFDYAECVLGTYNIWFFCNRL